MISTESAHEAGMVVSPTHPGKTPGTHFYYGLSWPQGYSAAGRIKPLTNLKGPIGNRTRDLRA